MKWDLAKVLKNPDIAIGQQFGAEGDTAAAVDLAKAKRDADRRNLTAAFEQVWQALEGPELVIEYRFHAARQWRADYAHIGARVLIELEGGVWSGGRHNRGQGYINDCQKYNAATALGWSVFRLATGMIAVDNVQPIINHINKRIA
jgi:very-short-patch-repair endonuclease